MYTYAYEVFCIFLIRSKHLPGDSKFQQKLAEMSKYLLIISPYVNETVVYIAKSFSY